MELPETANALTAIVSDLIESHKMEDFETEVKENALRCGATEESLKDGTFTPLSLLDAGRRDQYDEFIRFVETLDTKYRYREFHEKATAIRNAFEDMRPSYLYSGLMQQCFPVSAFLGPVGSDEIFVDWFDGAVRAEAPNPIRVEYEDLDGSFKTVTVVHKPDEFTLEYTSCRPLNRYSGSTPYDAFLMRHYYCPEQEEWIAIPIQLIKSFAVTIDE
jgi:hypothetical protein